MTHDEARERVARGAAHLDRVRPGWHRRIDTGTLTLWDSCGCVVGQLCGSGDFGFSRGLSELEIDDEYVMGFDMSSRERYELRRPSNYSISVEEIMGPLQDAWIAAIADRLLAESHSTAPVLETVVR